MKIQEGRTIIENREFISSLIKSVEIPEGVTTIGEAAFKNCKSLKSASVPKGAVIQKDAFDESCEIKRI